MTGGEKKIQNTQYACDFCADDLNDHWYKLNACQYVGFEVISDFYYRLCSDCYPQVQTAVRQALTKVRKEKLQEFWAKFKQEFQPAGKI
jgi:hypothetical protein